MTCTKMTMLYEKYKTEWMLEHGITMNEFIRVLDDYRTEQEQDGAEFNSIEDVLDSFEADSNGFDGKIWACYDEWEQNEFFEELCDRIRDKVRIGFGDEEGQIMFYTPIDGHEVVVLSIDENHDDWGENVAEFILFGEHATNEKDESEKFRSVIITWLWLNDEKGNAY